MSGNNSIDSYYNNKNIVLHELIGLHVKVILSHDLLRTGLSGSVIDETKNTLVVDTEKGVRKVIKSGSVFEFAIGNKRFIVEGKEIAFHPHKRIKKGIKFYKRRD